VTIFLTASLLGGTLMTFTDRIMTGFPDLVRR
jgi:type III secretory pathway component EscS